jgi:hypothetical protein
MLYIKTSGKPFDFTSSLLGNEKALTLFESLIERKSSEVLSLITHPI